MIQAPPHRVCALLLACTVATDSARAQAAPTRSLGKASQTFPEPFSRISGLREQSDGKLVVLDKQEIKILRVDMTTGRSTELGRSGNGPGEYTLPLRLVALPDDSTLAVDMSGGGRAIVITRDGVSGVPLRAQGFTNNKPLFYRSELQSDQRGRIYELTERMRLTNGQLMRLDSSGVRRLDRLTGKEDTLGTLSTRLAVRDSKAPAVKPQSTTRAALAAPRAEAMARTQPVFPSHDQWAVAPDGRIALVSVYPYRVSFVAENGAMIVGPTIPAAPIRMSDAFKARWQEMQSPPALTISYGAGGKMSAGHSTRAYTEPKEWPDELPPFLLDAVQFAPDGNLWIERTTPVGVGQTFDIIDRAGKVASRLVLPVKSRLVGLGARSIYIVRVDADDLEHLERHVMP